jgi:hypothetical protein
MVTSFNEILLSGQIFRPCTDLEGILKPCTLSSKELIGMP